MSDGDETVGSHTETLREGRRLAARLRQELHGSSWAISGEAVRQLLSYVAVVEADLDAKTKALATATAIAKWALGQHEATIRGVKRMAFDVPSALAELDRLRAALSAVPAAQEAKE